MVRPFPSIAVASLAAQQAGALSRPQLLALGVTDGQIDAQLASGRWQRPAPSLAGVYLSSAAPVEPLTRCWTYLLYAGSGAVLAMESAAWLWGLQDTAPDVVHVMVPTSRRVAPQVGLRLSMRVHLADRTHPTRRPPATRIEDTVIDLADAATSTSGVIDVVTRSCQRRLTTAARLQECCETRKKLRRRALLAGVLTEVTDGVQSPLERSYLRDVERAHGLPRGERNLREGPAGRRRYRDVRYRAYRLVVELDGRAAHPTELVHLDQRRDNELMLGEDVRTLRLGWRPVTDDPCACAAQVSRLLQRGGWTGTPKPCGAGCRALPAA